MTIVSTEWLERKIKELNDWLVSPDALSKGEENPDYKLRKRDRDYFVQRLIELEENGLTQIKV